MKCNFLKHIICTYLNLIHSSTNYCECTFTCLTFVLNCITGSDGRRRITLPVNMAPCMRYFQHAVWETTTWKQANLHENWIIQTLESILNISAKCHQNRSLQFWDILFQSWCVFLRHSVHIITSATTTTTTTTTILAYSSITLLTTINVQCACIIIFQFSKKTWILLILQSKNRHLKSLWHVRQTSLTLL